MAHRVFLGLGANLDQPAEQIRAALRALDSLPQSRVIKSSALYTSSPLGPQDQPDYVNAVCLLETQLAPDELLQQLQRLEIEQGRVKKRHWGERTIDLDILLYDDLQLQSEHLQIPHSQMHLRDFVLVPLAEIAPGILVPGRDKVEELIAGLQDSFLRTI
ncbi:2-amino-4-hydroxy-6-hydroxymethyldihydropteridine diphosphokinase [Thiomicrorhabdus xiamenensis]|uniref:2-amino-4-hydroxy-6-hydroxymethyldihydropteridine pyrophosphokinase n=1 Tax=Thiomicrorhabdus xiamenensis TaxID=2739063 RepID=A0A7D4P5E3_9GAMM|nr:2-amino-4-hydroxy-6-hydroxymethyldihydropteridine diphosphokinase [Thiomicrorhabdus xiamenensis]QKI89615.1 2-amino-4-hydroxy-6-hydroxymethyldihydropteridine diphosphokinase [Thiomicrorhabdus xiamenensis]